MRVLAALLFGAAGLVASGFLLLSLPFGLIATGALLGLWSWLFFGEVDG